MLRLFKVYFFFCCCFCVVVVVVVLIVGHQRYFILLSPLYDYPEPERVCNACVRRCSNLDYANSFSVFPAAESGATKLLIFGPEMQTRRPLEDLAKALSARYTVVTFDLPGLGGSILVCFSFAVGFIVNIPTAARDSEKLTDEACRKVVSDAVEKHAVGGAPVMLCGELVRFGSCRFYVSEKQKGIGMSAYVILKTVAAIKARKVFGLILIGASKNHYRPSKLMLKGIGMLYKVGSRISYRML